jgi:hypothetical protein
VEGHRSCCKTYTSRRNCGFFKVESAGSDHKPDTSQVPFLNEQTDDTSTDIALCIFCGKQTFKKDRKNPKIFNIRNRMYYSKKHTIYSCFHCFYEAVFTNITNKPMTRLQTLHCAYSVENRLLKKTENSTKSKQPNAFKM